MRLSKTTAVAILSVTAFSQVAAIRIFAQEKRDVESAAALQPSLSGRVVGADGRPVAKAIVTVAGQRRSAESVTTDDAGLFTFQVKGGGPFVFRATAHGVSSNAVTRVLTRQPSSANDVVLTLGKASPGTASEPMSFSDDPSFVISGVTDWSAVGGHGSDATLRTSEDLARTTSALAPLGKALESMPEDRVIRLKQRLASNPDGAEENRLLGEYYQQKGEFSQAIPYLQAAVVRNPSADNYELLGQAQEQLGEPLQAVHSLQRAVRLGATEPHYFSLASELLLHRAVWQASEVFARGVAMFPDSFRMRVGLGSALFGEARYDDAATQLCAASELKPGEEEPYQILSRVDQASPAKLSCVRERLARFHRVNPNDPAATYWYAMTLLRWGAGVELQQASALLTEVVQLEPENSAALLQLGILTAKEGRFDEAVRLLKRSIAADPHNPDPHFRLAVAYEHTGQAALAKEERERHEALKRQSAEEVEKERRSVKQFIVQLNDSKAN